MSGRRLAYLISAVSILLLASGTVRAQQQDVFKCVDDRGNVTFQNTGNTKGCTRLVVDPVVIPKAVNTTKSPTPSGFPKVDNFTQKARDSDRRRILDDELRDKQARLSDLRREYNNGEPERQGNERNYQRYLDRTERLKEDIARAESDIASIRSEISKVQ
ncbi:MAG: DUF4124 domain-containing protein [Burkholderiaceae bacterium]